MRLKLLAELLHEAILAWRLEGRRFNQKNLEASRLIVLRGEVYSYSKDDEGDERAWLDWTGIRPSQLMRELKHGYLTPFDPADRRHDAER